MCGLLISTVYTGCDVLFFLSIKNEFQQKNNHILEDTILPLIQQLSDHVVQHEASLLESTKQLRVAVCVNHSNCSCTLITLYIYCLFFKAQKCEQLVKQHTSEQRRNLEVVSTALHNEKSRQVGTQGTVCMQVKLLFLSRHQPHRHTRIASHLHLNSRKL